MALGQPPFVVPTWTDIERSFAIAVVPQLALTLTNAVIVTAAEWAPDGGIFGILSGRPLLGAANVWVSNIGPHGRGTEAGGVEFHLHVEWGAPLFVVVTITVLEPFEQTFAGN